MPREIKAYACKYKCGHRINTKKEAIEFHEKICFSNPKRKACKTCKYWVKYEHVDCVIGYLKDNEYGVYDCPHHKLKSN